MQTALVAFTLKFIPHLPRHCGRRCVWERLFETIHPGKTVAPVAKHQWPVGPSEKQPVSFCINHHLWTTHGSIISCSCVCSGSLSRCFPYTCFTNYYLKKHYVSHVSIDVSIAKFRFTAMIHRRTSLRHARSLPHTSAWEIRCFTNCLGKVEELEIYFEKKSSREIIPIISKLMIQKMFIPAAAFDHLNEKTVPCTAAHVVPHRARHSQVSQHEAPFVAAVILETHQKIERSKIIWKAFFSSVRVYRNKTNLFWVILGIFPRIPSIPSKVTHFQHQLHSLRLTATSLKIGLNAPKGKYSRLSNIHFQVALLPVSPC